MTVTAAEPSIQPSLATTSDALVEAVASLLTARDRTEVWTAIANRIATLVDIDEFALHELIEGRDRRVLVHDRRIAGPARTLVVPLDASGRTLGAIELRRRADRQPFLPSEHETVQAFARLAALALLQDARRDALEQRARCDWLTGLYNAGHCHAVLTELCDHERRFALVLLDCDDLKLINDEHGHRTGDETLRLVGHTLRRLLRADDLAFRLGGDEFVVLLCEGTRATAERLTQRIERELVRASSRHGLGVRLSSGFALAPEHGRTAAELMHKADIALYESKRLRKRGAERLPVLEASS